MILLCKSRFNFGANGKRISLF